MNIRSLRDLAGLAAAIVPCAIVVHLVAEAAATGCAGLSASFMLRHAYFVVMFAFAAFWFATTVGLGRSARERRRRCALLRSEIDGRRRPQRLLLLIGTNLGFFALTQAVEGIPILSGAVVLGLGVALAGSLLSPLLVVLFGGALVAAVLDSVIGTAPGRRAAHHPPSCVGTVAQARHATFAYSLFVPNRPPPNPARL